MKLSGLVSNSYIYVSASRLYVPTIGPPILLQQSRRTDCGREYINCLQIHECGNLERGRAVSFLEINKSDLLCSVGSRVGKTDLK